MPTAKNNLELFLSKKQVNVEILVKIYEIVQLERLSKCMMPMMYDVFGILLMTPSFFLICRCMFWEISWCVSSSDPTSF